MRIQKSFVSILVLLEAFVDSWSVGSPQLSDSVVVFGGYLGCPAAKKLRSQYWEFGKTELNLLYF